jgi:outer membrane receptor protein involved in Fe transport
MRNLAALAAMAGLCAISTPALAEDRQIDIPAGTLGQAIASLGAQARVSIVVAVSDPGLMRRAVPRVRGRMSAGRALDLLLRGSGARGIAVAPGVWRIVAAPPPRPKPRPKPFAQRAAPLVTAPSPDDQPDIVVTASKRSEKLDTFAGTVTILSGAEIGRDGETGTDAIAARVATISSTYLGAGRNKLFIRGIADSSFTGPTQSTVGQYVGDVRLTYNAPDPDLRLYDIESIEVLEGPQGTLYGAGSLGGIIRIVRNTPQLDAVGGALTGGVSATWHGQPSGDLAGVLNLPIVGDTVGLRVVGYGVSEGGYIDNPLRGENDINRSTIYGGRAMLRSKIAGWTIDLGGTFQQTRNRDSQYADTTAPPLTQLSRLPQGSDASYALGELIVGRELGDLQFVTTLGAARQRLSERYDASLPNGPDRLFRQRNATNLFSLESRVSRPMDGGYGWVLGVSLVRNTTQLTRALGDPNMPVPATGVTNRITEATGYAEFSITLLPRLILTAGGRYSLAWLDGEGEDVAPMIARASANLAITAERNESAFLPSLALSARPIDGLTFYARYQQSYRPGGLAIEGDFVRRFRNDRASTFEVGLRRGSPGVGRADFALSVSRTIWRNIQADFIDLRGLPSTANIGDGRIWSLSASAGWAPISGMRIEGGIALNDSKVTSSTFVLMAMGRPGGGAVGSPFASTLSPTSQVPNIANVVARGSARYEFQLTDNAQLSLSASARYTGKSRLGVGPILGEAQGDYVDTRVSARLAFDRFALTLSGSNLTDEVGNRFALGTPFALIGQRQITPLRPRTIRLGFDTAF